MAETKSTGPRKPPFANKPPVRTADYNRADSEPLSLAEGWSTWAPRPEIAPKAFRDPIHARGGKASLGLSGESNPGVFGGWERVVKGVQPDTWYRFQASYLAEGLDYAPRQVVARLDWLSGLRSAATVAVT